MTQFNQSEERSILLNAMADNELTEEQERRLIELLQVDEEFRVEYVRFCQLLTQLRWQYDVEPDDLPTSEKQVSPVRPIRSKRGWWQVSLAVIMLLMVVVGWLDWNGSVEDAPIKIVGVSGRVGIVRNKQPPFWISPEEVIRNSQSLQPGDSVQTGRGSSATLQLSDQTRIRMQPKTEVVVYPQSTGGISVPSGSINANVTTQSPGNPLTFFLPNAEVQVLGTELELLSIPGQSEVAVLEGKVQVTRKSDGSKRFVSTGQFLPVFESRPLSVVDWPRPADEWSVDFENGLPVGWEGQQVRHALPNNSQGAVRSISVRQDMQTVQKIQSPQVPSGLFFWHDDSLLHLRFKIQPPGWFHIYLHARTYQNPQPVLTYCYVDLRLWQTQPGEWRTVSIPLSEFHLQTYTQDNPALGCIPLQITFSGESETDGFMIDRIWVTRANRSSPQIHNDVPSTNGMR
ncbi:FecR family protein [Gimesia algae]|uniref:FecR protein n=1 Tax=Gimesia algae TaxID=2527971 RepID=A0A517VKV8_9PLAN|nr:FecR family protein [Gimesia algae]QDT93646.1 FecR protein [Gimesia algae]